MSIGEKMRRFGLSRYSSLGEFATALDMSLASLSQYLNDKSLPGAKILQKLRGLGCDMNWLLDENETSQVISSKDLITERMRELMQENAELKERFGKIVTLAEATEIVRRKSKSKN
jgi:transcriptional regulator with XRE-family HTH domain